MRDPEATSRWKNAAKSRAWWCKSAPFPFIFTDSDHRFSSSNVQLQNTLFMISFFYFLLQVVGISEKIQLWAELKLTEALT